MMMKKNNRITVIICFFLALLFAMVTMVSCNTPPDPKYFKDGVQYGEVEGLFRERWWNFYERGVSFSDGGFWEEAASDFKQAIRQRDTDQYRARTYGMHFTDYFPYRDLGVAYYHLGEYDKAMEALEKSFEMVETSKTKFYLNEVRKSRLKAANVDGQAPAVTVAGIEPGTATNSFSLSLDGIAKSETYTRDVVINEEPLFIELAEKELSFGTQVTLKNGLNEITIRSTDLLGNLTEEKIEVFGDFQGPAVNINNYTDNQEVSESRVVLRGALADASGITSLQINDQVLAYNKEREVDFTFTLDLIEGENKILFAATDAVGNTTTGALNLVYVPALAEKRENDRHPNTDPMRLAMHGSGLLDTGQHLLFTGAVPQQMGQHFRLDLKDLTDTQTVYYENIYIDGSVTGIHDIQSVSMNGIPQFILPGRTIYFSQILQLDEGENTITLEVADAEGNVASKSVTVVREVPTVRQIGSRMSVAVMPFDIQGDAVSASGVVYDNLVSAFFDQQRFNIVTRGDELEAVLRELKLSQTDLVDRNKAVQVGRLVAAEGILMGTIRETQNSIEIYARLVNTETSAVFDAKDVYAQDKSLPQIRYITNGLALKFKHSFPLLEGMVIKSDGRSIYADFGSVQNIRKDMKFIVFREGEKIVHPITGKVLGSDLEELGVATVVNVFDDMSVGRLLADFDTAKIAVQDLIITK